MFQNFLKSCSRHAYQNWMVPENVACFSVITAKFLYDRAQSKKIIVIAINYAMRMIKGIPSVIL